MTQWTLTGTGPRTADEWPNLHHAIDTWQSGWADLDGFHLDAPPQQPPLATHLWAWTRDTWLRVRIHGDHWTASALFRRTPPPGDSSLWPSRNHEPIAKVRISKILSWSMDDGRVRQLRLAAPAAIPPVMWQLVPIRHSTCAYLGTPDTLR